MAMTGGTAKLVKTTYPFSDKSKAVNLYIYYKTSQNVETNKSTITCGMYVTTPSGWDIGQWDDWNSASYVGTTSLTFNGTIPNFSGTRWIAENKSFAVDHNPDGSGTATIQWKWAVNSPWGGFVNASGSFSITLPQIPRATTPTLSATSVQMGKSITVTMNRAASSFTHTLKYTLNGTTGDIGSGLGTSYTWAVPNLVHLIPNATSGTVTITCTTYSGTQAVGSKTVQFKVTTYDATTPTITGIAQMGEAVIINTPSVSDKYTHTLRYTIGSKTGAIASGVGTSHKWSIPISLVSEVTNAASGTVTISCLTMNGTATVGTKTINVTVKVPSASVPTVNTDGVMGEVITIKMNPKVEQYTHAISYTFGGETKDIAYNVASALNWNIPYTLASKIPNATSGTVTITCVTKNGTATVGTNTCTFKVTVPDNDDTKPVFSATLSPVHSLPTQFAGMYLLGKCTVSVTFDAESEYAYIKKYKAKIGTTEVESDTPNIILTPILSGDIPIIVTVTDSRGYSRTDTKYITVVPYERPRLAAFSGENNVICTRSMRDGTISHTGEYVLVKAVVAFSDVLQKNKCRVWYRYKTRSSSDYGVEWVKLDGIEINTVPNDIFNVKTSYTYQLKVEDDVGEERVYSFSIADLSTPVHMGEGGRNLGLGQFCDYSEADRIDVGWKTYFNTGIGKKVIFEADDVASGWNSGETLNDVITDADTTMVANYNIFIAVVSGGGKTYPVLCIRHDWDIYGIFSNVSVQMHYSSEQENMTLESITDGYTVTALYALL